MEGFKKFLLRGNLIDLAVAVVIGAAFSALVNALVSSFITPLIAAIGGKPDFDHMYFTINGSKFTYGVFLNALISFAIIAAVIYFLVVKPASMFVERFTKAVEATERDCPECLSEIPIKATRCKFCASEVTPTAA